MSVRLYLLYDPLPTANKKQLLLFAKRFSPKRPKKVLLLPVTRPTLKKFKFSNPNFVYNCMKKLQKNSCAGKWERSHSPKKPKKVN